MTSACKNDDLFRNMNSLLGNTLDLRGIEASGAVPPSTTAPYTTWSSQSGSPNKSSTGLQHGGNKEISNLLNKFSEISVTTNKESNQSSFSKLLKQQAGDCDVASAPKANSDVQQRLKDLQNPIFTLRRSMSEGSATTHLHQKGYSHQDLQALNDYYADQAKMEFDAKIR
uniref:Uncharacterized protein n=1 Tax=Ciona savignyi TaxID=51511 RepID=H2YGJ7_CIOSA